VTPCNVVYAKVHRPGDVDANLFIFRTWHIVGITVLEFHSLVKCIQSQNIKIRLCPLAVGHAVAQWLRHCAGSIPHGVNGIFH
jgi:hypothetical protein